MNRIEVLELSTAHVTQADMEILDRCQRDPSLPLTCANDRYSCWLYIPEIAEQGVEQRVLDYGLSMSLVKAMRFALGQGVRHMRLDCDVEADDDDRLDVHEW